MALYFFQLLDGGQAIKDFGGQELPNAEAAKRQAVQSAREQISSAARRGDDVVHRAFRVFDQNGEVVFTLPFRDSLKRR
jgi:hypothetical protein